LEAQRSMRAIIFRKFGAPSVMRLEEVEAPALGAGDVLIAVRAVTVNRTLDLAVRAGRYVQAVSLPHILGADPSGVIVATGSEVESRKVGDRVVTSPRIKQATATEGPILLGVGAWGGYAEFVRVPAAATYLIPDGLGFAEAAVIARHAPMAFHLLEGKARLAAGETVLVMGATGGLGSAGVQVAKHLGAHVIAGVGAEERAEAAKQLGADEAVNYRSRHLDEEVMRLTGKRGVDVVFENIGDPDLFPRAFASLARGGRLVTAGSHGGGMVMLDVSRLYLRQLSIFGSTGQTPADIARSLRAAAEGHIRAPIARTLPLEEAALAHELIESGTVVGKIVLTLPEPATSPSVEP
jgi:NADPH:quinone reductase